MKLSSLYVYVSRGLIESHRSADGRRSLFRVEDVELLAGSRGERRPGSRQAAVITSVTQLTAVGPSYRGVRATALLGRQFEDVAELLWQTSHAAWVAPGVELPSGLSLLDRIRAALLLSACSDRFRADHSAEAVFLAARSMIALVVASLAKSSVGGNGQDSIAGQISAAMVPSADRTALKASVDAALCLLADHELATSTRAVRLAASTRADLGDAFAAGLGVLVGPTHGGAAVVAVEFLRRCSSVGVEKAIDHEVADYGRLPGFGSAVYPEGDPRFAALRPFADDVLTDPERDLVDRLLRVAGARGFPPATVDLALGALVWSVGCEPEFATAIFAAARMAGWTAHYLEALAEPPDRDRTRAAYATRP